MTEGEEGKLDEAERGDRALRSIAWFWLFVVLVLLLSEAVLVLDRSCNCIIPPRSTRSLETF
jgi:hypothetical protein